MKRGRLRETWDLEPEQAWPITLSALLWLAAVLLRRALFVLFLGEGSASEGSESGELAALVVLFASPILILLVVMWVRATLRCWRWGIIGLPPALLFFALYGSWLYAFLTELVFA